MMKTRLVGFLGLLSFVLCTAIPQTAPAQVPQKKLGRLVKIDKKLFKPVPGLILKKSECAPGEISSPRSWDIGSGDSGGTICVPRCGPHYQFLPQSDETTVCRGFIEPGSGCLVEKDGTCTPIVGGYTCRFIQGDPPFDDACPSGSVNITQSSAASYTCSSSSPIPEKLRNCIKGYSLEYYLERPELSPEWRYYFHCQREGKYVGFDHLACTDPDAQLIGGGGGDNCCAYQLGPPPK